MAEVDEILELRQLLGTQREIIHAHLKALINASDSDLAWSAWKVLNPEAPKRQWTAAIRLEQSLAHEVAVGRKVRTRFDRDDLAAVHAELIERVFGEVDPWRALEHRAPLI